MADAPEFLSDGKKAGEMALSFADVRKQGLASFAAHDALMIDIAEEGLADSKPRRYEHRPATSIIVAMKAPQHLMCHGVDYSQKAQSRKGAAPRLGTMAKPVGARLY